MKKEKPEKYQFTRKELYDLVWQKTIKEISKEFLISNTSLKKICSENKIPLPGGGYWTKLKYGKAPAPDPLPACEECEEPIVLYKEDEDDQRDLGLTSDFHLKKQEIERDSRLDLEVSKRLKEVDPIIEKTRFYLKQDKKEFSLKRTEEEEYVYVPNVSKSLMPRTLRILNSLFKALRARGHDLNFESRKSEIQIGGMKLDLRVREKHKRVFDYSIGDYKFYKLVPIEKLVIAVDRDLHKKEWHESDTTPFEKKISTVVAGMELFAQKEKEYQARLEKHWAELRVREKEEKIIKEKRNAELEKLQELLDQNEQWQKVRAFREFLDELERLNKNKNDTEQEELIKWARKKADWMDPLIEREDEILGGIDPKFVKSFKPF